MDPGERTERIMDGVWGGRLFVVFMSHMLESFFIVDTGLGSSINLIRYKSSENQSRCPSSLSLFDVL